MSISYRITQDRQISLLKYLKKEGQRQGVPSRQVLKDESGEAGCAWDLFSKADVRGAVEVACAVRFPQSEVAWLKSRLSQADAKNAPVHGVVFSDFVIGIIAQKALSAGLDGIDVFIPVNAAAGSNASQAVVG